MNESWKEHVAWPAEYRYEKGVLTSSITKSQWRFCLPRMGNRWCPEVSCIRLPICPLAKVKLLDLAREMHLPLDDDE